MRPHPPPPELWQRYWPWMVHMLRWAIAAYYVKPFRLTDWHRSPAENASTPGSARDSQHLIGTALDLAPLDGDVRALAEAFEGSGMIVLPYDRHVHVQVFRAGQRPFND